jgi:excisionase family DNA binding protein
MHHNKQVLSREKEARILSFSQHMGEFITAALTELLTLLTMDRQLLVSPKTNTLLTAADVAKRLNISNAKAYQLMRDGDLPSVRFGRTTRVRPEDLEKLINGQSTR